MIYNLVFLLQKCRSEENRENQILQSWFPEVSAYLMGLKTYGGKSVA